MQDIEHLRKVISDQNGQIARLKRQIYNEPPPSQEENIRDALDRNNELLEDFIRKSSRHPETDAFTKLKQDQIIHARRRLLYYQDLSNLKQRKTDECPCGEHQGIEFLNSKGEPVDHLCPRHWWIMQTWVTFDRGTLKAFVESTPLDWYLKRYEKKEKK